MLQKLFLLNPSGPSLVFQHYAIIRSLKLIMPILKCNLIMYMSIFAKVLHPKVSQIGPPKFPFYRLLLEWWYLQSSSEKSERESDDGFSLLET